MQLLVRRDKQLSYSKQQLLFFYLNEHFLGLLFKVPRSSPEVFLLVFFFQLENQVFLST